MLAWCSTHMAVVTNADLLAVGVQSGVAHLTFGDVPNWLISLISNLYDDGLGSLNFILANHRSRFAWPLREIYLPILDRVTLIVWVNVMCCLCHIRRIWIWKFVMICCLTCMSSVSISSAWKSSLFSEFNRHQLWLMLISNSDAVMSCLEDGQFTLKVPILCWWKSLFSCRFFMVILR